VGGRTGRPRQLEGRDGYDRAERLAAGGRGHRPDRHGQQRRGGREPRDPEPVEGHAPVGRHYGAALVAGTSVTVVVKPENETASLQGSVGFGICVASQATWIVIA
jgi:hypothetical protein